MLVWQHYRCRGCICIRGLRWVWGLVGVLLIAVSGICSDVCICSLQCECNCIPTNANATPNTVTNTNAMALDAKVVIDNDACGVSGHALALDFVSTLTHATTLRASLPVIVRNPMASPWHLVLHLICGCVGIAIGHVGMAFALEAAYTCICIVDAI